MPPPQLQTSLDVTKPCWLFARTCRLLNKAAVVVYRSTWLSDTDEIYAEVRSVLTGRFGLALREEFADTSMVFGAGELSVYLEQLQALSESELERLKMQACEVLNLLRRAS